MNNLYDFATQAYAIDEAAGAAKYTADIEKAIAEINANTNLAINARNVTNALNGSTVSDNDTNTVLLNGLLAKVNTDTSGYLSNVGAMVGKVFGGTSPTKGQLKTVLNQATVDDIAAIAPMYSGQDASAIINNPDFANRLYNQVLTRTGGQAPSPVSIPTGNDTSTVLNNIKNGTATTADLLDLIINPTMVGKEVAGTKLLLDLFKNYIK